MRLRSTLFLCSSLLAIAACGGDETDSHDFETGTYAVSSAALASATDGCGLLGAYTDPEKVIGISVDGDTATFNLSNDSSAEATTLPTATLSSNVLAEGYEANYLITYGACNVRVKRSVTGELTDNNKANLTLTFNVTKESGTCTASDTDFLTLPCDSSYNFVVTKKDD